MALLTRLEGHREEVRAVTQLPDGRILSASADETVRVWRLQEKSCAETAIAIKTGRGTGITLMVAVGGSWIATTCRSPAIDVWDMDTNAQVATLAHHLSPVTCLLGLGSGRLVSGCHDGQVALWELPAEQMRRAFVGHTGPVTAAAAIDVDKFVTAADDHTILLWNLSASEPIGRINSRRSWVRCMAHTSGTCIATAGNDQLVWLWDMATCKSRASLAGHTSTITCMTKLGPDLIVTAGADRTLRVWDTARGQYVMGFLTTHTDTIKAMTLLANNWLVTASRDVALKVWHLGDPLEVNDVGSPYADITSAATAAPDPSPTPGKFELVENIDCGRMGAVHSATMSGYPVAVTAIPLDGCKEAEETALVQQVAQLCAFRHCHVSSYFSSHIEVASDGSKQLLVSSELVQRFLSQQQSAPSVADMRRMCQQVFLGLAAMHCHNPPIQHFDLNPHTVGFCGTGETRLTQFGVSDTMLCRAPSRPSAFWSPERLAGLEFDAKDDVWAASLTLVYAGVGLATPAATAAETVHVLPSQLAYHDRLQALLSMFGESYGPVVTEVLRLCLQREPAKRISARTAVVGLFEG